MKNQTVDDNHEWEDEGMTIERPVVVKRWAVDGERYWPSPATAETIPPGFYKCEYNNQCGSYLVSQPVVTDTLIPVQEAASCDLLAEFHDFWSMKREFDKRGFLHKRGILMWGPPGSGKTASLMLMCQDLISHGGIAVQINHPSIAAHCLRYVRAIEPTRPVLGILEDFELLVQQFGEEGFLTLLDGENQVDSVLYVATTNFPEKLNKRFMDRPSRFDTIRYVGMPSDASRRAFLLAKEPSLAEGGEINAWVAHTDGFSMAHLRELIILVRCFNHPLDQALARLEYIRTKRPSSGDVPPNMPAWADAAE